jgi:hypothetical protein
VEFRRPVVEFRGTVLPARAAAVTFRGVDSLTGTKDRLSPRDDQNSGGGGTESFSLSGTVITEVEFDADDSIVGARVIHASILPGVTIVTDNLEVEDEGGMKGRNSPSVGIDSEEVASVTGSERAEVGGMNDGKNPNMLSIEPVETFSVTGRAVPISVAFAATTSRPSARVSV